MFQLRPVSLPTWKRRTFPFRRSTETDAALIRISRVKRKAPASEGGRLYLGVRGRLAEEYRRVALAERPSGREARSENSVSLFCRSAPRPNFLKLKRITGHKSLHLQAQLEIAQGRGARATAYSKGGVMDKMAACGIEVSAQELVVALTG